MLKVRRMLALVFLLCLWATAAQAQVVINEILARNGTYENGQAYDWIELKNDGTETVDLSGYVLSLIHKNNEQVYTFSQGSSLKKGEYAIVYCAKFDTVTSKKANIYYAPLDISKKSGSILLQNAAGDVVDSLTYDQQYGTISYGRVGDTGAFQFLATATKGAANANTGFDTRAAAPHFSVAGGLYESNFSVSLSAPAECEIRFTVDGSEPTEKSPLYQREFTLFNGVTCIRARAFQSGALPSEVISQTYLIGVQYDVPVVSLITDDKYLFNSKTGVMTRGDGATPNYEQNWEYPVNIEYFEDGQQINQIGTFRVTGATSRAYGQKTISIFARAAYGDSLFNFNPFNNRDGYDGYKSLTLRAAGTESFQTRFRDPLLGMRAVGLGIYYQEQRPVVVYVNGEYFGHYNLAERVNKHSLAQFEGVTDEYLIDTMTIIKGRGEVQQGSRAEWDELIKYLKKNDLNDPEKLKYVTDRLDVESYFTHTIIEMIIGNADIGNVRYYKIGDGKWKCALYDLDAGMMDTKRMPISYYNKSVKEDSRLFYHEPFAALIKVPEMKDLFFTLFGKIIMNYLPADLERDIDTWVAALSPLMADQIARWPKPSPKSYGVWEYEIRELRAVCRKRPQYVVSEVCSTFKISSEDKQKYFGEFLEAVK